MPSIASPVGVDIKGRASAVTAMTGYVLRFRAPLTFWPSPTTEAATIMSSRVKGIITA